MVRVVILITNFITPYRKVAYDKMYEMFKKRDIKFMVYAMSRIDKEYGWDFVDLKSEYMELLPELSFMIKRKFYQVTFNPGALKILYRNKPDIIILGGDYLAPINWSICKGRKKNQVYFWSESHLEEKRKDSSVLICIRELLRKSFYGSMDGFIYPGVHAKAFIKKYSKEGCKYIQYPNLIDNAYFYSKMVDAKNERIKEKVLNVQGIKDNKKIFLCVARLEWIKGIDKLLTILAKCRNKEDFVLLLVGRGSMKEKLMLLANQNDVATRFLGFKTPDELIELYATADCFILPSLSDPNPLSVIEAMWCELPIVVSNHVGNYPETIIEDKNGYVLNIEDINNSVLKMEKLILNSDEWYKKAGKLSRKIAEQRFDLNNMTSKFVEQIVDERSKC